MPMHLDQENYGDLAEEVDPPLAKPPEMMLIVPHKGGPTGWWVHSHCKIWCGGSAFPPYEHSQRPATLARA